MMPMPTDQSPRFEVLEDRLLLAGDVTASLSEIGGDLELLGDDAGNRVVIVQKDNGEIFIRGKRGTTINGQRVVTFEGRGLDGLDVQLFGGRDSILIRKLRTDADMIVETGTGDDVVILRRNWFEGNVTVLTDGGDDRVIATRVTAFGDLDVETGAGRSNVSLNHNRVGGSLSFLGDRQVDVLSMIDARVDSDILIDTGDRDDRVFLNLVRADGSASVVAGDGDDTIRTLRSSAGGDYSVEAGAGDDLLMTNSLWVGRDLHIDAGAGDNDVRTISTFAERDAEFLGDDRNDFLFVSTRSRGVFVFLASSV
jgi:hypothetical protein